MDHEDNLEAKVVANSLEISHTKEIFTNMVKNLEEKVDDLKVSMNKGFEQINRKLDSHDSDLEKKIDERIQVNEANKALTQKKWIIGTFIGSIAIALITTCLTQLLFK